MRELVRSSNTQSFTALELRSMGKCFGQINGQNMKARTDTHNQYIIGLDFFEVKDISKLTD